MTKTCGDHGGTKADGEPCTRIAGWGTDRDTGPCKYHTDEESEKKKALKKDLVEYLQNNLSTLKEAAGQIGKSEPTVWRWRQNDPEFDKEVERALDQQNDMRVERVKDSLFQRIVNGDAAAAETIFWLKNNADWKDDPPIKVEQSQSQMSKQGMSEDRLQEILGDGLEKARERDWEEDDQEVVQKQDSDGA